MRPTTMLAVTVIASAVLWSSRAPVSAQAAPAFEVASVKPNTSESIEPFMSVGPRGPVVITNVPLQNVIINAFRVPPFHVIGGPDWIRSERFDITAKPPDSASPGQIPSMLQALLVDRFKLHAHRETRDQPTYNLVLLRKDRPSPLLKRSSVDCEALDLARRAEPNPTPPSSQSPCNGFMGVGPNGGTLVLNGRPLSRLVGALGMAVNRTVVDQTGLDGAFDIELRWGADVKVVAPGDAPPAIYTAIQEQLGLKLEPARGAVEVLVIDSVERPAPD